MKFDIPKKEHPNLERYYKEDVDTAYKFANEIYKELGSLIRAVVIFGSTARRTKTPGGDIDILVVIDDVMMNMSPELVEAYRLIVQKSIVKISTKLHITTMRFTSFWEYMRNGDPIAITHSPTLSLSESPKFTVDNSTRFTLITARSEGGSVATIFASNSRLSNRITLISSAPSITWLLVTIYPLSVSTITPEPKEWPLYSSSGNRPPKGSKNC